ncbi:serpin-ZX-like [Silene latifolia]|uniref:serpin-ZX-like n=1 Tax=Silene latifolia TaxID=37657 RepID=UPI003D7722FD
MDKGDMDDLRQLITDQTHVSLKIAHHVASTKSTPTNSVFSPLSLHVILGLIAAGSSGSTRDELLSVLGSNSIDDLNKLFSKIVPLVFADGTTSGGPRLRFANGVWVDESLPFKPEFKRVVEDLYKASCTQVNFAGNNAHNKKNKAESEGNKEERTRTETEDDLNETEDSESSKSLVLTSKGKRRARRREERRQKRRIIERSLNSNGTKADEVASEVNSWAEKQTGGLIKDLLPPGSVDNMTRLIFANALYFKGEWNQKFDRSETEENDFHLLDGTSVKVPFMTSYKKQFIRTCHGFKVLELPYKQGKDKRRQFSMIFLLPNKKDGLLALSEKVASKPGFLDKHLPTEKVKVGDFRLPRFKISFGFEASKVLKGLGINLAFSGGDLTEMVDSPEAEDLYVSNIFHKAFIKVNEEGTEAAAASAIKFQLMCAIRVPRVDFVADHPFIYLIRENTTGVVLFVGHVVNPLKN